MKNLIYLMLVASILMLAACSSDDAPFDTEETSPLSVEIITMGVGLPGSDVTRLEMNELTEMVWSEGEHLDVYGYTGGVCSEPSIFTLKDGAGTATGIFTGARSLDWDTYEINYKGSKVEYTPNVDHSITTYSYLYQVQTAMNDFGHIKEHLHLRSGKVQNAVVTNTINLKPQCSILKLNVKNLPDEIKDAETMTVRFYLETSDGKRIKNAELALTGKVIPKSNNYMYMAFEPGHDLQPEGNLIIAFLAGSTRYDAMVNSKKGKNYEPGSIYTVTMDYQNPGPWTWTKI